MLNFSVIDDIKRWSRRRSASAETRTDNSLDIFGSEQAETSHRAESSSGTGVVGMLGNQRSRVAVLLFLVIILAGGLTGYLLKKWPIARVQGATGSVTIESDPAGADVVSAGRSQGVTPLTVAVAPGDYVFEVIHNGRNRPLKVTVAAGGSAVHYVHFDAGVSSAEAGTAGSVDAVAPVKSKPKAPAAAGPAAGWVSVTSPVALDILEGGNIVGTSQSSKIMMPVGRHELRLANQGLGFSDRRVVQVTAGSTAAVRIDIPNAPLSINAQPWAEIWIDGNRVGETPIGNHLVRIGSHEIILRHPDLGERRQTVTVSLTTPARVSVDMRKQ
ncbi:MAG: PEGA domain-containing protein [Vicinamibacterales bacterium]